MLRQVQAACQSSRPRLSEGLSGGLPGCQEACQEGCQAVRRPVRKAARPSGRLSGRLPGRQEALSGICSRTAELSGRPRGSANHRNPAGPKSSQLESAIYSFIHGLILLQPQFYRVFSNILEPGDLLGSSPNGSGRLEEASSGFELAQEGFSVASSGFESAPKWPRGE